MRKVAVRFWRSVVLPALERELPDRDVVGRPHACDGRADVDRAELSPRGRKEAIDVVLARQVGLRGRCASELGSERRRALGAAVVVDEDARSLGREQARTRRADAAGGAGDDDALPCEARIHEA